MTVYVDNARLALGRMKMSHMIADSTEELVTMAELIGLDRRWLQHPGTWQEHFDVSQSRRELAVRAGAQPVSRRKLAAILRGRRR